MILSIVFGKLRAWLKFRESVRELSALTDRELSDIGLSRGNIERTARNLAFR